MRFIGLFFLFTFFGCAAQKMAQICAERVSVVDRANLDGCTLLLQSENGQLLLPNNGEIFNYQPDQQLAVSYAPFDGMSTCMAAEQLITLTCVQRLSPTTCRPMDHADDGSWMEALLTTLQPRKISRYEVHERYYYELEFLKDVHWYDCQGFLVCSGSGFCQLDKSKLGSPITIYLAHR